MTKIRGTKSLLQREAQLDQAYMAGPTAGWDKLGDDFYQTIRLYELELDLELDLDGYLVAGATCAGAFGISATMSTSR